MFCPSIRIGHGKDLRSEVRLEIFASEVITFTKSLDKSYTSKYLGEQIIRSACSAALNYAEAVGAGYPKDVIHKNRIVLKELKETRMILRILNRTKPASTQELGPRPSLGRGRRTDCNCIHPDQ